MTENVEPMDAELMKKTLEDIAPSIREISLLAALEAFHGFQYENLAVYNVVATNPLTGETFVGWGDAAEMFAAYKVGGGPINPLGTAISVGAKAGNFTVFSIGAEPAIETITAAGGILSMSVPVAAAAIAPLLGVGLGVALYELAPNFWTRVSQTLLPFCWTGTQNIPAVVDSDGQVYIEKSAVDAIKDLFDELNIGKKLSPWDISPISNPPVSLRNCRITFNPGAGREYTDIVANGESRFFCVSSADKGAYIVLVASPNQTDVVEETTQYTSGPSTETINYEDSFTYNGKTVYYGWKSTGSFVGWINSVTPNSGSHAIGYTDYGLKEHVAWSMIYGEATFPEGSYQYDGNTPVDYTQGKISVFNGKDGTRDFVRIRLPSINPGATPSTQETTDPQSVSPDGAITPRIPNEIPETDYPGGVDTPPTEERTSPVPNPTQETEPSLDPETDPSLEPTRPQPGIDVPDPIAPPPSTSEGAPNIPPFPPEDFPSINSSGSGFIHVYRLTAAELKAFGAWLWVTWHDAKLPTPTQIDASNIFWNNPFDGVLSAHELYITSNSSARDNIRSGFLTCSVTGDLVNPRYKTINCGTIVFPEYYNNYLDYSPYTKVHANLPFVGIVELTTDDIVGHAVNIKYIVDSYNGSCIAQIFVAKDDYECLMYQYSGNCAVDIPLSGGSMASAKAGMISAAAGGIASVVGGIASIATGRIGAGISTLVNGAANVVTQSVSQKSSVQHSGSFGASFGAMGAKKPYIFIHRPVQKQIYNYGNDYGQPAFKKVIIKNCTGFLKAYDVHVISPTASDEEKAKIEELLKSGVFV